MKQLYRYGVFFICLFAVKNLTAQNITGTWEGLMPGEYLMISVEQKGNELCGYTYDYELRNKNDHCIAAYVGRYDSDRDIWYISGRSFIENSGTHVFMRIIMWEDRDLGKNSLKAMVYTGSGMGSFLGMGGNEIVLRKISNTAKKLPEGGPDCFPKPVKPPVTTSPTEQAKPTPPKTTPVVPEATNPVEPKPSPAVPDPSKTSPPKSKPAVPEASKASPPKSTPAAVPEAKKPAPPPAKPVKPNPALVKTAPVVPAAKPPVVRDTVKKVPPAPPTVKAKPDADLVQKMNERKQQQQSRLQVNVKRINLKVYDNGVVDNDTVSIFYNGKLLISHQRLSEQAIELNIDLDETLTEHNITMFAENLGGIPPNTAVIIVTAGDKRYELRSKASLEENAVLIFEYKPRE